MVSVRSRLGRIGVQVGLCAVFFAAILTVLGWILGLAR